jgi:hypothetical protein
VNWFQQNRWLGTFLIVFGAVALLSVFVLWQTHTRFVDANARFAASLNEKSRLERLDPFPNDANYEKMKEHLENYNVALTKIKEEMKTRMLPMAPLAPNEFQARLRQVTLAAAEKARANKVKLPPGFHMGFDEYTARLPEEAAAPLLGQELLQTSVLLDCLIDSRVDNVATFRRPSLRKEQDTAAASPTPKAGSPQAGAPRMIDRNVVDVTFFATSAAARAVLNRITSSSQQFYIIRTLYVRNEKEKGPPREEGARAQATPAPNAALSFIVGTEHVQVSARVEKLRFNF